MILFTIIFISTLSMPIFAKENTVDTNIEVLSYIYAEKIFTNYYRKGKLENVDVNKLIFSIKTVEKNINELLLQTPKTYNINEQNELLYLYLKYAEIISTIYNYGLINHHVKLVKNIDKNITSFLKLSNLEGRVYLQYANYLYTKLLLFGGNKLNIILTLPILYRKAVLLDKTNTEALVKLSCWYISASNETTSNFNAQISYNEQFIEDLNLIDKYNAYIWYSIYYMKNYNVKKGWDYFNKAKNIFPSHILISRLYENYKKGFLSL